MLEPVLGHQRVLFVLLACIRHPCASLKPVGKHTSQTLPTVVVIQALDIRVWVTIVPHSILVERLHIVRFNNHPVMLLTLILGNVSLQHVILITVLRVQHVVPGPLQILEPALGHLRVRFVPRVCIRHHRTCLRVQTVPPLLMLPLFNAPPAPIKPLQPVTPDIMENLVMFFVKYVVPVPLQIPEPALGQQRVIIVLLGNIR